MRVWIFASGSRIARIVLQSWVLMASFRPGGRGYGAMACSRQCRNRTIARQSFPLPSSVRTLLGVSCYFKSEDRKRWEK